MDALAIVENAGADRSSVPSNSSITTRRNRRSTSQEAQEGKEVQHPLKQKPPTSHLDLPCPRYPFPSSLHLFQLSPFFFRSFHLPLNYLRRSSSAPPSTSSSSYYTRSPSRILAQPNDQLSTTQRYQSPFYPWTFDQFLPSLSLFHFPLVTILFPR